MGQYGRVFAEVSLAEQLVGQLEFQRTNRGQLVYPFYRAVEWLAGGQVQAELVELAEKRRVGLFRRVAASVGNYVLMASKTVLDKQNSNLITEYKLFEFDRHEGLHTIGFTTRPFFEGSAASCVDVHANLTPDMCRLASVTDARQLNEILVERVHEDILASQMTGKISMQDPNSGGHDRS